MVGEIARGIHRLDTPIHARRRLEKAFLRRLLPLFRGPVLPFDQESALLWGQLMGEGERHGRTPPARDCEIAATALAHGMTVVTRDARDFERLGVGVLNLWTA